MTSAPQAGLYGVWLLMAASLIAGCAGGTPAIEGAAPNVAFTPVALPIFGVTAPGKPSEVYVVIARQAKACWFAPPAPLQQGFVFTADVSPDRRGGAAVITIFEHNTGQHKGANAERGQVAYQITLSPNGDQTSIGTENSRIPDDFAQRMKSDVERWAAGETSCGTAVAWSTKAAVGDGDTSAKPKLLRTSTR